MHFRLQDYGYLVLHGLQKSNVRYSSITTAATASSLHSPSIRLVLIISAVLACSLNYTYYYVQLGGMRCAGMN